MTQTDTKSRHETVFPNKQDVFHYQLHGTLSRAECEIITTGQTKVLEAILKSGIRDKTPT